MSLARAYLSSTLLVGLCFGGSAIAQDAAAGAEPAFSFYGQFSPALLSFDDGEETLKNMVDNAHSNSRIGFNIDHTFDGGESLRFNFETALGIPQSSAFSQTFAPVWEWDKTKLRKFEFILDGDFGTVSAGQGSMATDGTTSQDLSGTTIVGSRAIGDTAGGYFYRQDDGFLSDITISDANKKYDGTRRFRLRYDTPDFYGFSGAAAYGKDILNDDNDNTYYDVALYYGNEYSGFLVESGAGYNWTVNDDSTTENYSYSLSVLHQATGLNGTVAGGGDPDGGDFIYGKAGWIANLFAAGETAFSADYYSGSSVAFDGSDTETWGVQYVQEFDDLRLQTYVGYRSYDLSGSDDTGYKTANSVMAGVRWQF